MTGLPWPRLPVPRRLTEVKGRLECGFLAETWSPLLSSSSSCSGSVPLASCGSNRGRVGRKDENVLVQASHHPEAGGLAQHPGVRHVVDHQLEIPVKWQN